MAVAKALKKTEGLATENEEFPKWCQMTDPDDGSTPECKKVDLSPLRMLYPSVLLDALLRYPSVLLRCAQETHAPETSACK